VNGSERAVGAAFVSFDGPSACRVAGERMICADEWAMVVRLALDESPDWWSGLDG
jgi:hypothetical protein